MRTSTKAPLGIALAFTLALLVNTPVRAGIDILACASTDKGAVAPSDLLNCEGADEKTLEISLAQLYASGWRLIEATFYDGTRPVLYLEREVFAQ